MTPSGIEPATFRFVAQHLNHCATAVPYSLTLSKTKFLVLHVVWRLRYFRDTWCCWVFRDVTPYCSTCSFRRFEGTRSFWNIGSCCVIRHGVTFQKKFLGFFFVVPCRPVATAVCADRWCHHIGVMLFGRVDSFVISIYQGDDVVCILTV